MKRNIVKKAVLPLLAAVLVLTAAAAPSLSYFTTYVTARGGETLHLEDVRTFPHEEVDANVKNIWVENTGDGPCYTRVKVLYTGDITVSYDGSETGWTDGNDGYWYYSGILQNKGERTSVLKAAITFPASTPEKPIPEGTVLNVEVITECAPVLYDENGEPLQNGPAYAGWALDKEG